MPDALANPPWPAWRVWRSRAGGDRALRTACRPACGKGTLK